MRERARMTPDGMAGRSGRLPVMTDVERALSTLDTRVPADPATLERLTAAVGMTLPHEYLTFMARSDGGEGDLGPTCIEIWPAVRVLGELESRPPHYEGVVLFAGN